MDTESFEHYCRICLKKGIQMLSFETELTTQVTIEQALESVMSVKMLNHMMFSEVLCATCSSHLKVAYDLKSLFMKSADTLVDEWKRDIRENAEHIEIMEDSEGEIVDSDNQSEYLLQNLPVENNETSRFRDIISQSEQNDSSVQITYKNTNHSDTGQREQETSLHINECYSDSLSGNSHSQELATLYVADSRITRPEVCQTLKGFAETSVNRIIHAKQTYSLRLDSYENNDLDEGCLENIELNSSTSVVQCENEVSHEDDPTELINPLDIQVVVDRNKYHILELNNNIDLSMPVVKSLKKQESRFKTLEIDQKFLQIVKDTLSSYLLLKDNGSKAADSINFADSVQYNYHQKVASELTDADISTPQENTLREKYKCQFCFLKYMSQSSYKQHLRSAHAFKDKILYMCDMCLVVSDTLTNASMHLVTHLKMVIMSTKDLKHKCQICGKALLKSSYLLCHLKSHFTVTNTSKNQSDECKTECTEVNLNSKTGKSQSDKEINFNSETCKNQLDKEVHFNSETSKNQFDECETKNKEVNFDSETGKNLLKRPRKDTEEDSDTYQCHICDHISPTKKKAKYHLGEHTDKRYNCEICNRTFVRRNLLNNHLKIHTGKRNRLCSICGIAFFHLSSLEYHLRIHNNERKYPCTICNKKFIMSSNLKAHMKRHQGDAQFDCSYCHMKFITKNEKNDHEMKHTGAKRYWCEYCGKGFIKSWNMKVHIMNHSGSYSCDLCSKTFIEDRYVGLHKKNKHNIDTHNGVRTLSYLESTKTFVNS